MSARLIRSADPLVTKHLILCAYGLPDTGKTSLAFTSNKPLLIDFDGLVAKAPNRNQGDVCQLDNWADFENLEKQVDLSKYETIIIDTAGRAVDLLEKHVKQLAMGNSTGDGNLSQKGWGAVKRLFEDRLDWLKKIGKDVILLVHLKEDKSGEETLDRFDIDGGSRFEIYKSAHAICRIVVTGKSDKRFLDFSPHEKSIGKNPGRLAPVPFDDPTVASHTLANVIQQIKDVMNTPAAKPAVKPAAAVPVLVPPAAAKPKLDAATVVTMQMQEKAQAERKRIAEQFIEEFDRTREEIKKQPRNLQLAIHQKALSLGLRFNREKNFYEYDPNQTTDGIAVTGNTQATGKSNQSEPSQGDATRGLPSVATAGVRGSVVTAEGARP